MLWLIVPPLLWVCIVIFGPNTLFDEYYGIGTLMIDIFLLMLTTALILLFGWMMGNLIGSFIPQKWVKQTYQLAPISSDGRHYVRKIDNINISANSPLFSFTYHFAIGDGKDVKPQKIFDYYRDKVDLQEVDHCEPTYTIWHGSPASWWGKWIGLGVFELRYQLLIPTKGTTYL